MVRCELLETNLQNLHGCSLAFIGEAGETVCVVGQFDAPRCELCALCEAINADGLDAVHIHDVVEDAIAMWGPVYG